MSQVCYASNDKLFDVRVPVVQQSSNYVAKRTCSEKRCTCTLRLHLSCSYRTLRLYEKPVFISLKSVERSREVWSVKTTLCCVLFVIGLRYRICFIIRWSCDRYNVLRRCKKCLLGVYLESNNSQITLSIVLFYYIKLIQIVSGIILITNEHQWEQWLMTRQSYKIWGSRMWMK